MNKTVLTLIIFACGIFAGASQAELTAWWPLDEQAGPAYEIASDYPNGSIIGSPVFRAEQGPTGTNDWAYSFEGTASGVQTGIAELVPAQGDFTITAWIKTSDPHTSQAQLVSNNIWPNPGRCALGLQSGNSTFWAEGFTSGVITSTTNVSDGQWHEVSVSRIGSMFYMLVDRVVEDTYENASVSIDQTTNWRIAQRPDGTSLFNGLIADVKVYDTGYDEIYYPASNPSPSVGAENVDLNASLEWKEGVDPSDISQPNPDVKKYYLLGNFSDPSSSELQHIATLDLGDTTYGDQAGEELNLQLDETYYWRVDEAVEQSPGVLYPAGDPNNIVGGTWTFTAQSSVPVITQQPEDVLLDAEGDDGVFEAAAESESPMSYAWYKSDDFANDTFADDVQVGGNSAVLTVSSAQIDDEGFYYCELNNSSGTPVYTSPARLAVKRQLAYWTMDEEDFDSTYYLDMSTEDPVMHNADPNGTPAFVSTGIQGDAVSVDSVNSYADAGTFDPSRYSDQITISAWVRAEGTIWTGGGNGIVTKADESGRRWMLMIRSGDGGHAGTGWIRFSTYNGGDIWVGPDAAPKDEWTHIAAVVDGSGTGKVYLNGILAGQDSGWNWGTAESAKIWIGKHFADTFPGDIDDVKIYNYALSELDIALEYTGITGESICLESQRPSSQFDVNGDCIVNFEDFTEYAAQWLDCGLVPSCLD
ncbi:LamG-like jellyroll fold domain-containing protein [Sedimentisphaera salicampi]|uniref:Immunoglobulin I-set domain protein n=1 Tax=Sedimentisphaera salicampi TaxID=1941349 RepID=A0A1W6LMT6_9BACT|nr:LamG-like jellyroll fold domain-containing protein [Sedimentisphaera salicampi]ARN57098.1 Immunoglobulin I-set domain protein [Sedimentisphaera salicampi]OXU14937.1 Immunoglobulin I-set domain protein [Sedimentisphaera salicampi]